MGEVLEEVYENESRQRGGEWGPAAVTSTDTVSGRWHWGHQRGGDTSTSGLSAHLLLQSGAAVPPKEEVACPQGWHIAHDWHVDVTGAVDEAGEWVSPPWGEWVVEVMVTRASG